jgi:hypothetical protein
MNSAYVYINLGIETLDPRLISFSIYSNLGIQVVDHVKGSAYIYSDVSALMPDNRFGRYLYIHGSRSGGGLDALGLH